MTRTHKSPWQATSSAATAVLMVFGGVAAPGVFGADAATLADVYAEHCAVCHGVYGRSDTPNARALKVAPLVDDDRLAGMTPAEIVADIRSNPKHRAVVDLNAISKAELLAAAAYVRSLCAGR